MKRIKRSLLLVVLALFGPAISVPVQAVNVDIYQNMESGNDGGLLTPEIMEDSTHGGISGVSAPDWIIAGSSDFWVSTQYGRPLPGTVTVGGASYKDLNTRTLKFSEKFKDTAVDIRYGTWRGDSSRPYGPYHDRVTIACYYTTNADFTVLDTSTLDTIIQGCFISYAVLQTIGTSTKGDKGLFLRAHGCVEDWKQSISETCIPIVPGKTYWVNLHFDGPGGECKVAAFDPDNGYAQVGDISVSKCTAWANSSGKGATSRVKFGRADNHSDYSVETFGYFEHILIDYTEGKFPLLPDVGSDKWYWVSPDGKATWQNAKSVIPLNGADACSLAIANANAKAGDTVYLRGGTYLNGTTATYNINPSKSGTVSARITYSNYNNEIVTISGGDTTGVSIRNKSHITVRGINFYNIKYFMSIFNSHHNIVEYCVFDKSLYISQNTWPGAEICNNSQYNWVHHCTFSRFGGYNGSTHSSDMLIVGYWSDPADDTSHNLIENNDFFYGGHSNLTVGGNHNVIRDNYLHNEAWASSNGYIDAIIYGATAFLNLFEGNTFSFSGEGGGITLRTEKNIFRSNLFYRNYAGGVTISGYLLPGEYNHFYNNVFFKNGWGAVYNQDMGGINFHGVSTTPPYGAAYNVIKNNIFHLNKAGVAAYDYGWKAPNTIDNNWPDDGDPLFVYSGDGSDLDPFGAKPDFRLKPASPCIDAGTFLTTITSPGATGTSFTVADALYFMDGWGMSSLGVQGDEIQLLTTAQRARITKVDYATHTITVDKDLSWTSGQGVSLAYEDSAPDLGAYEYAPGLYLSSPSGGKTWVRGFSYDITWNSIGIAGKVKIELIKNGVTEVLDGSVPIELGSYSWQIQNNRETGNDYLIKITSGSYADESAKFNIAALSAPMLQTLTAQSVTASSALLRGTVHPMGLSTTYYFEYGLTKGGPYNFKTSDTTIPAGDQVTDVQTPISGLTASTTYYFRLKAKNDAGKTGKGAEQAFTTTGHIVGGGGGGDSGGGGGGGGCFIAAVTNGLNLPSVLPSLFLFFLGIGFIDRCLEKRSSNIRIDRTGALDLPGSGFYTTKPTKEKPMKIFGLQSILRLCAAIFFLLSTGVAQAVSPHFDTINGHEVLMVNDKPFLLLSVEGRQAVKQGTQADVLADMDWAVQNHCNSYKANIVWQWMETSQNVYDWTFLDQLVNIARSKNIKIHLVYSGFNHCADSDPQVPAYISNDKTTYQPIVDSNGNYVYVRPNRTDHQLCPNDPETLDREKKMVAAMMAHLRVTDSANQTVVMVQNQNEPHVRNTLRCHCSVCNSLYSAGSWNDEERFHAYSLAKYIEELTVAGKAEYDLPFNINAIMSLSSPNNATAYKYLQLYLDTAPHIDLIGPDQYSYDMSSMRSMLNQFKIGRNIVYLAETTTDGFATKTAEFFIYQVLGEFGGIGQSPWSVHVPFPNANTSTPYDQGSQAGKELGNAYKAIKDAMSPIATYQTTNSLAWFVPNAAGSFTRTVNTATLNISTANDQGKGIIVQPQAGVMDFTLVGNDFAVSLPDLSQGNTIVVEQGRWDDMTWLPGQTAVFVHAGGLVTVTMPQPCTVRVYTTQASDTTAPTVPTNLSGVPMSSIQVNLSWTVSTDNLGGSGLAGYRIYRDGTQVAASTVPSYNNTGLSANTSYSYTVSAYDMYGNESAQSSGVTVTTLGSGGGGSGGSGGGGGGCFIAVVQGLNLWFMASGVVAGWLVWTTRRAKSTEKI